MKRIRWFLIPGVLLLPLVAGVDAAGHPGSHAALAAPRAVGAAQPEPAIGAEDAVGRSFVTSRLRPTGTLFMTFAAVEFDTERHMRQAVAGSAAFVVDEMTVLGGDLHQVVIGKVGTAMIAYKGSALLDVGETSEEFAVAVLGMGVSRYLHLMIAIAVLGDPDSDPLGDLALVARNVVDHRPGRAMPAGSLRDDGLWALLPQFEDLPDGFELDVEYVPEPFGSAPEQGADEPPPTSTPIPARPTPTTRPGANDAWDVVIALRELGLDVTWGRTSIRPSALTPPGQEFVIRRGAADVSLFVFSYVDLDLWAADSEGLTGTEALAGTPYAGQPAHVAAGSNVIVVLVSDNTILALAVDRAVASLP